MLLFECFDSTPLLVVVFPYFFTLRPSQRIGFGDTVFVAAEQRSAVSRPSQHGSAVSRPHC